MSDRHVLPPYSLRMPADLREQLETSSQKAKRSLNAEIVSRLELSLIADQQLTGFLSAERARKIAELAGENLPKKLREAIQAEILSAATSGVSGLSMSTDGLGLDPEIEAHHEIMDEIVRELHEAGYNASYSRFFEIDISFWAEEHKPSSEDS